MTDVPRLLLDQIESHLTRCVCKHMCRCCWVYDDPVATIYFEPWDRTVHVRAVLAFKDNAWQSCKNLHCVRPNHQKGGTLNREFLPPHRRKLDSMLGDIIEGLRLEW